MKHRPLPHLSTSAIARFWSYVERLDDDDCWLWRKAVDKNGYGKFSASRHSLRAHRVAYFLSYGVDPLEQLVCHTCDTPGCCNPNHLFLGTNQENILDARDKGRLNPLSGDEHGLRVHPEAVARGEQHPNVKLTADQAREVRRLYSKGQLPQHTIADKFGITREAVSRIIRGLNWKHIIADDEPISLSDMSRQGKPGEQNNNAKLTADDVRQIRILFASDNYTKTSLAKQFNVTSSLIGHIIKRRSWKHLD